MLSKGSFWPDQTQAASPYSREKDSMWGSSVIIISQRRFVLQLLLLHLLGRHLVSSRSDANPARSKEASDHQEVEGWFLGVPVGYRDQAGPRWSSTAHCVGENFVPSSAWMVRSCQFRQYCFYLPTQEWVVFRSSTEQALLELLQQRRRKQQQQKKKKQSASQEEKDAQNNDETSWVTISTLLNDDQNHSLVSLAPLYPAWYDQWSQWAWYPRVLEHEFNASQGYYYVNDSVLLVPYHLPTVTPYLLWTDFFPVFTLASMFGLQQKRIVWALRAGMGGACHQPDVTTLCRDLWRRWMMVWPGHSDEAKPPWFEHPLRILQREGRPVGPLQSDYVCAAHGAAGVGLLTDPGLLLPPSYQYDVPPTHAISRGADLRDFSTWILQALARGARTGGDSRPRGHGQPRRVVSWVVGAETPDLDQAQIESIMNQLRNMDWTSHTGQSRQLEFQTWTMDQVEVPQLALVAAGLSILLVRCEDASAVWATFLPRGAAVLIFCDEADASPDEATLDFTDRAAVQRLYNKRLEKHILDTAGYFRTQWLPLTALAETTSAVEVLARTIRVELDEMDQDEREDSLSMRNEEL